MYYSDDDYTDAEAEENDAAAADEHLQHGEVEGCSFCELEQEQLAADEKLDALIELFVMEPSAEDREAARRAL